MLYSSLVANLPLRRLVCGEMPDSLAVLVLGNYDYNS
jgi:hypothetical protein